MKIKKMEFKRKVKTAVIRGFQLTNKPIIHFLHIGKTGGSAIRSAIQRKSFLSGDMLFSSSAMVLTHGHNFRLKDVPKGEYAFFVVREPISRFVSGFYSRLRKGYPKNNNPWSKEEEWAFTLF